MPHQNMNYIITVLIAELVKDKKPLCDIILSAAMAFVSSTSPITTSEDSSETDLNINNTEDEIHMDISNWTPAQKKKLQHMTEFHEEYQWIFGEKASIHTIMKRRISCMNPLFLPLSVRKKCKVLTWMPMKSLSNISWMLKEIKSKGLNLY